MILKYFYTKRENVLLFPFFCICWLLFGAVVLGQNTLSESARTAEYYLHCLELEQAKPYIEQEKNPLLKVLYGHHALFLNAFVKQEKATFRDFFNRSETLQDQAEIHEKHRYYHFVQAEIYLERTIIKVLDQNLVSALNDLRRCYSHAQSLKKDKNTAMLADRFSGIFLIAFSAVPKQYKWALDLFGLEGNLQRGVTELKRASEEGELLRAQNRVVLYFVTRNLLAKVEEAGTYIHAFYAKEPSNVLYTYLYAHNCIDRRDNTQALQVLHQYLKHHSADHFPFVYNLLGRCHLFQLNYDEAVRHFDHYHRHFRGVIYRADAYYRKGICYALQGNKEQAVTNLKRATELTDIVFDEDKFAQKESRKHLQRYFSENDLTLLKARFLLDGGYHAKGKKLLDDFLKYEEKITSDEKTEVYYRLARMYDVEKDYSEAKVYYRLTFLQQPTARLWMKAYAMLFYAVMMEKSGQYAEAQKYFKQALQFDGYDYQPGMEQKAKAGLQRIKPMLKQK